MIKNMVLDQLDASNARSRNIAAGTQSGTSRLPATALSTTARDMMQSGLGLGEANEYIERVAPVPSQMGCAVRNGKVERLEGQRRAGSRHMWETASMAASYQVHGERAYQ
tara:strand:- start:183 stop:512 length:330 start_codon:yes stop_codon:yes gene_type:complete